MKPTYSHLLRKFFPEAYRSAILNAHSVQRSHMEVKKKKKKWEWKLMEESVSLLVALTDPPTHSLFSSTYSYRRRWRYIIAYIQYMLVFVTQSSMNNRAPWAHSKTLYGVMSRHIVCGTWKTKLFNWILRYYLNYRHITYIFCGNKCTSFPIFSFVLKFIGLIFKSYNLKVQTPTIEILKCTSQKHTFYGNLFGSLAWSLGKSRHFSMVGHLLKQSLVK